MNPPVVFLLGALVLAVAALVALERALRRLSDLPVKLRALEAIVEGASAEAELLPKVLATAMRALGATSGSIVLVERGLALRVAVASPAGDDDARARVGEGIIGTVARTREPVFLESAADPRARGVYPHVGRGTVLVAPIMIAEHVLGVVSVARPREGRITASDRQFLAVLGGYVGYRLEEARLVGEARQSDERVAALVRDLRATQEHLVRGETLRTIGQLSSGMAHHLNNLFTVILARLQLLIGSMGEGEMQRALAIVKQAALDAAEVVRRVQRFGDVQPLAMPVPIHVSQMVTEVVELLRPRWQGEAQRRGVEISVSVEASEVPAIAGDPAAVREAIMNVLLNAIDALSAGGAITVKTWAAGGSVRCAVTDTGVGMSEEVRRQAFEPFFTTKGPKRTGLGLSVAYGIVERHGGSLAIESREGAGTKVTITLPIAADAPAHHAPAPAISTPTASPLRLLVVDDELEVRLALADILEAQGHQVVLAASGREALAMLELGEPVNAVLTDLGMPGMSGREMAQKIKARWPRLPVGLVTGWSDTGNGDHAFVDFVVTKPFGADDLERVLRSAVSTPGG